jgi:hypothetical protein
VHAETNTANLCVSNVQEDDVLTQELDRIWRRARLVTKTLLALKLTRVSLAPPHLHRHPGWILGLAIALSEVRGFVVFVLFFLMLWAKLSKEEQWMRSQFGETYAKYVRRTAALVPYLF